MVPPPSSSAAEAAPPAGLDADELARMAAAQESHWWYRGLHDLLRRTLPSRVPRGGRVLDAGCGTGHGLALLDALLAPALLAGFDVSPDAVALSRARAPTATVFRADLRALERAPLPDALDLVLSLDVVYAVGLEAALPGLQRLARALVPGGHLVLHLPALPWLFGSHDLAIGTVERFTRARLEELVQRLELDLQLLSFRVCLPFPLVVLARLPGMLRHRLGPQLWPRAGRVQGRSDLAREALPGPFDRALEAALHRENAHLARGGTLPLGSSLFAIARRPRAPQR